MDESNMCERRFEERLHAIHAVERAVEGEASMDTGRAEMLAMFDSFLGEDFDGYKKESVIELQQNLHRGQVLLAKQFEENVLTGEEYVDGFNRLLAAVFEASEEILGISNFEALFGAPRAEMHGYIDKDMFLAAHQKKPAGDIVVNISSMPAVHFGLNQTVLIVDNSERYRERLHSAFENVGCRVLMAENAWVALEVLKSNHPDLMLVDIKMPTMTGYELVEIVHKRPATARMPVLMMASAITNATVVEAKSVGASYVFSKLSRPEEWISEINRSTFN